MTIIAATIAHNEPDWIRALTFGGVPVATETRPRPDVIALCEDGAQLWIERKTSEDLLHSLREEGNLFLQCAALAQERAKNDVWPYVVITGTLQPADGGFVSTERGVTGWRWASVQGALLTIQEMGVFVAYAANDEDFEGAVIRLAQRKREPVMRILPARMPSIMPREYAVLADLGIHPERAKPLLEHCGNLHQALSALQDSETKLPGINAGDRRKVSAALFHQH